MSECCDPEIRGRLGSLPTLAMSLGIVLSYVAGNWLMWRYLAFFSAIFCGNYVVLSLVLWRSQTNVKFYKLPFLKLRYICSLNARVNRHFKARVNTHYLGVPTCSIVDHIRRQKDSQGFTNPNSAIHDMLWRYQYFRNPFGPTSGTWEFVTGKKAQVSLTSGVRS